MYMQKVYADKSLTKSYPRTPFRKPDGFNLALDCGGYHIDSSQRYIPPKVVESKEEEILN
jgi:penicillin-binding protein 1A